MKQLSIDFNPDISKVYPSCVEYVAARVHQQGIPQKAIAADMDLSPSQLAQKLHHGQTSSARFTLDDLEKFMQVTGDIEPLKWLISKYLYKTDPELLKRQIAELQAQLESSK